MSKKEEEEEKSGDRRQRTNENVTSFSPHVLASDIVASSNNQNSRNKNTSGGNKNSSGGNSSDAASSNNTTTNQNSNSEQQQHHPILTISLTGGPCGGKTGALVAISTEVQRRTNFKVFCVPEAATLLVGGGLEWKDMNFERTVEYQHALLRTQVALEDNFRQIARACGQPALILCDRGTMDGRSYCTPEQWDEICKRGGRGCSTTELRDGRYDAVVHMVTAAMGAESFYNFDNPARFETVEGARDADLRLRQAYLGHPRIRLIDNKSGQTFQDKVNAAVDFVFQCIGHAPPRHDKRRFLLRWNDDRAVPPVPHEVVNVTATILAQSTPEKYSVTMLRQTRGHATRIYLVTGHEAQAPEIRAQQQMYLTENEYNLLNEQRHPEHIPIEKRNYAFEHQGAFYDLAVHLSPPWIKGYATLYVDGLTDSSDVASASAADSSSASGNNTNNNIISYKDQLPAFLKDAIETTQNDELSSFHQSKTSDAKRIAESLTEVLETKN